MDIYKEMWKIAEQIEELKEKGYYPNVDMLIDGFKHQLSQLGFFYNKLVPEQGGDASKTFYNLRNRPSEHQLIYTNLNRGYPKELFDVHYCYILKDFGTKFIIIPATSIKPLTCINAEFEMEIEESDGTKCLLNFDEMKAIDLMRINGTKSYVNVNTGRDKILEKFYSLYFSQSVDKA